MRVGLLLALFSATSMLGQASKPATQPAAPAADSPTYPQQHKMDSLEDVVPTQPKVLGSSMKLAEVVKGWTKPDGGIDGPPVPDDPIMTFSGVLCPKLAKDAPKPDPGTDAASLRDTCEFKKDIYVFQIVRMKRATRDSKSPVSVTSSSWSLYRPGKDKHLHLVKSGDGKFPVSIGAHTGVIVSMSLLENPLCNGLLDDYKCEQPPSLKYDVQLTEKTAQNVTALTALINAILGVSSATKVAAGPTMALKYEPPKFSGLVQFVQIDSRRPELPFDWKITVNVTPSDTKFVVQDLFGPPLTDDATPDSANPDTTAPAMVDRSAALRKGDPPKPDPAATDTKPGDCTNLTKDAKCSFTHTVSVDGHQYWNVGINITPHGPRENKYALSNSNVVTQTHTIHSPLYAAFDFSPWSMQGYRPYFQVGVPLSGAAFRLPFVSVAEPLPFTKKFLQISVYGGVVFMKQTFPRTLAIGQTSNTAAFNADLQEDRALKPIFGIEVPVSSIISKVKSSVGAGK